MFIEKSCIRLVAFWLDAFETAVFWLWPVVCFVIRQQFRKRGRYHCCYIVGVEGERKRQRRREVAAAIRNYGMQLVCTGARCDQPPKKMQSIIPNQKCLVSIQIV